MVGFFWVFYLFYVLLILRELVNFDEYIGVKMKLYLICYIGMVDVFIFFCIWEIKYFLVVCIYLGMYGIWKVVVLVGVIVIYYDFIIDFEVLVNVFVIKYMIVEIGV